jgi:tetratricopeptide (TPR) repeat protein
MSRIGRIGRTALMTILSALSLVSPLPSTAQPGPAVQASHADIGPDDYQKTSDWPQQVVMLEYVYHQTRLREEALRRLQSAPASLSTVAWLVRAKLTDEMLSVVRRIVDERPDQIAEAFDHVRGASELQQALRHTMRESSKQLRAQLDELVRGARVKLSGLTREQQAALIWRMRVLEQLVATQPADFRQRAQAEGEFARRFVAEYQGTRAAALVEVDLIASAPPRRSTPDRSRPREDSRLAALAEYAATHPGTDAAAMALHTRAYRVAHGGLNGSRSEADHADRLVEVLRIVDELESGKYPRSRWTDGAARLVLEMSFYQAKLSAPDAERALATLLAFLRARPGLATDIAASHAYLHVLASTLPTIAAQTPAGEQAIERVFDELRPILPEPAILHLAKAHRASYQDREVTGRVDDAAVARELKAAAEAGDGIWSRRAWIALAEHEISAGRLADARARYDAFARRHPDSDFAWMAAIRIGQIDYAQGKHEAAARLWLDTARRDRGGVPLARVIGPLYAAYAFEAAGAFDRALDAYREAVATWTPDLLDSFGDHGPLPLTIRDLRARPDKPPVMSKRTSLVRRVEELTAFLPLPGGRDLERGRWLLAQGRASDAIATLAAVVKEHAGTAAATEARVIWHRARLDAAIDLAAATRPGPDAAAPKEALDMLEALSAESFDAPVGIAGIASATLLKLHGRQSDAETRMRSVLHRWVKEGTRSTPAPAAGTVEADALAVRDAIFRPLGGEPLKPRWNAFDFPQRLPAFVAAPTALTVKVAGGEPVHVDVSRQPPGLSNVIFIPADDVAYLSRLVTRLGGTARREPRAVMETPHQPIGGASAIITWWDTFFPARPGHWSGFEVLTYPAFSEIEFLDPARTRAHVPMTIGYSGATAVLEKIDGIWKVTSLVDEWIT